MKRFCRFLAVALAAATLPAWLSASDTTRELGPRFRRVAIDADQAVGNARVIVQYRQDTALMRAAAAGGTAQPLRAAELGRRLGLVLQDRHVLGTHTQSLSAEGISSAALAARIAALPDVEWAAPVHRKVIQAALPDDPYYGPNQPVITPTVGQWYLRAPDSAIVAATNAVGAWGKTTGSSTVTVAVLDTGVLFGHPDLQGRLYPGYDFIADVATAGDGNGRDADATDPGDWTTSSASCGAGDSSWHGTQTSSLIGAATNNGVGMASVGRDVMLLPVRVLGKCGGFDDDIQAGMLWAAGLSANPVVNTHPAQVINMSLGATDVCGTYQPIFDQLLAHGVTVVVAAGNDEGVAVSSPANCQGAIAVAGLRHTGTKVGYSSVGPEVAIAAPAGNCVNTSGPCLYPILTALNAGTTTATTNTYSDSFRYSVGTSFSAPLVAGTVALMLSVDPTLTPAALLTALQSTARTFPGTGAGSGITQCHVPDGQSQDECYCTTSTCGAGMLDTAAAVAAVTPSNVPPTGAITLSTAVPVAGTTVALSGTGSAAVSGGIVGYGWTIASGSEHATLIGASDGSTVSLATSSAGGVLVQMTVTDSNGATNSKMAYVSVQAPAAAPPGGGGGGGAMSALWIALLGLAAVCLRVSGSGRTLRQ